MQSNTWIKIDEKPLNPSSKNGVKATTYFKDIPNEIRMFRGTTTLCFGIDKISAAISEPKERLQWVERMVEDILIESSPTEGSWLSYEAYNLAWPVSDRDYVFKQTLSKTIHKNKNRTPLIILLILQTPTECEASYQHAFFL